MIDINGQYRHVTILTEKYMNDLGTTDTMLILPEFEFYLFDRVGSPANP